MYLIIYSIDEDYIPEGDFTHEKRDPQEGLKQLLFVDHLCGVSKSLFKNIKETRGINTLDECIDSEYIKITLGYYPVDKYYLTIHDFLKIDDDFSFCISYTKEYKDFVKKFYMKNKEYQEEKKKEEEEKFREKELKELQRLKEKYEK